MKPLIGLFVDITIQWKIYVYTSYYNYKKRNGFIDC
jgi:hypothetical protein